MIITAYLDESGTHGAESVATVMAGYAGTPAQWATFKERWRRLLRKNCVSAVHAIDLRAGNGEFKGWNRERRYDFTRKLELICQRHTLFGFAARLKNRDYDQHFIAARPKKPQLDSKYGLVFRRCIAFLPQMLGELLNRTDLDIHMVLESGHRNAGDVLRLFDLYRRQVDPQVSHMMKSVTFAGKANCPPLQAADIIAYPIFRDEQQGRSEVVPIPAGSDKWKAAARLARRKAPVYDLIMSKDDLARLRAELVANPR